MTANDRAMPRAEPPSTPRRRVEAECARRGRAVVIDGCARLLSNTSECEAVDAGLVLVLGGEPAEVVLRDDLPEVQRYWLRVWAARGLLWAWDADAPVAIDAIRCGLRDPAW